MSYNLGLIAIRLDDYMWNYNYLGVLIEHFVSLANVFDRGRFDASLATDFKLLLNLASDAERLCPPVLGAN